MIIESLLNAYSGISAYEVAEDLQIVAERLGKEDRGWKIFADNLRHINAHVSTIGEFPLFERETEVNI